MLSFATTIRIGNTYEFAYDGSTHTRVVRVEDATATYFRGWDESVAGYRSFRFDRVTEIF